MSTGIITTTRPRLSEVDLCEWIAQAAPGDILEYHRGVLGSDAEHGPALSEIKVLRQVKRRAIWAFDEGLVHLVQRRNGSGDFSYLAIRRPQPRAVRRVKAKPEPTVTSVPEHDVAT